MSKNILNFFQILEFCGILFRLLSDYHITITQCSVKYRHIKRKIYIQEYFVQDLCDRDISVTNLLFFQEIRICFISNIINVGCLLDIYMLFRKKPNYPIF